MTRWLVVAGLFGVAGCDELDIDLDGDGDGEEPPPADTGDRLDPFDPNRPTFGTDELTNTGGYFGLEPYGVDTGFAPEGIPSPGLF